MIARLWRGRVRPSQAEEYVEYVQRTGIRDQRATPGNMGSYLFVREVGGEAEVLVISLWESVEAILDFAGEPLEEAIYYPQDERYLLELEPCVVHYQVPVAEGE
jgi:heme-degrading monooxygenase HmoA